MARIGIYGGSFDPIHRGHVAVALQAFEHTRLDRLVLVPAFEPPHKRRVPLAPFEHRCAMVRCAMAGRDEYVTSDIEATLPRPSYTIRTVEALTGAHDVPVLVVGADSLARLSRWHRASELLARCELAVAPRDGFAVPANGLGPDLPAARIAAALLPGPAIAVSSTDVRARVRRGEPILDLVPDPVAVYIAAHGLYRE